MPNEQRTQVKTRSQSTRNSSPDGAKKSWNHAAGSGKGDLRQCWADLEIRSWQLHVRIGKFAKCYELFAKFSAASRASSSAFESLRSIAGSLPSAHGRGNGAHHRAGESAVVVPWTLGAFGNLGTFAVQQSLRIHHRRAAFAAQPTLVEVGCATAASGCRGITLTD